ncbi:MAG: hypothetical protein HZB54_05925, partial [Deltaproteobacteria bacterium]|nr:hypothetical protein [Deltaproteobacteria bacterium]
MQEMLNKAIRALYTTNLGVKKDERVLVFTDTVLPGEDAAEKDKNRRQALVGLARQVADVGSEVCRNITFITYPSLRSH